MGPSKPEVKENSLNFNLKTSGRVWPGSLAVDLAIAKFCIFGDDNPVPVTRS
jgi:hypothetical protein